jgi:hypothetical protein
MANQRDKSQGEKSQFGQEKSSFGQGQFGHAAESMTEQAKETATGVMESAREMASTATRKAGEAASYVGGKAQDASTAVGSGIKSLAGTIRENAPREGMLGSAGTAVADTLESSGRYLEEYGLSGIGDDLTAMIRKNPVPALLIGIGIGFLVARATRS